MDDHSGRLPGNDYLEGFGDFIVRSAKRYDDLALLAVSARPISRVRIFPE